jgi:ubiquinone/menaquinone biosynthesis C-methylase UbiE
MSTAVLDGLKATQQRTWSSGDYSKVAWITVPVSETLVEDVDLRAGSRVLDVAAGTGHAALAAARRFCEVTAIDYVPELLDVARRRADAEGLPLNAIEGDAENLPFPDDSFDVVLSALGVMFTADHQRAASELVRVVRAGGRIGIANWSPSGFVGQMLGTVTRYVPPPPAAQPASRWGNEDTVRALLGDRVTDVRASLPSATIRFPSPESFADFFLAHYGPTLKAAERLSDEGRAALRQDLVTLAAEANLSTDGSFVSEWEYLIVTATKS